MSIDPTQFLPLLFGQQQPSPFGGPLGAVSEGLSRVLMGQVLAPALRARMTQDEAERQQRSELAMMYLQAQRQQLEREPLERRLKFLVGLYDDDWRAAFQQNQEVRDLFQKLQGFTAARVPKVTVPGIGPAAGQGIAAVPFAEIGEEFQLPGAKTTGFRTLGEMAGALGLKLQANVSPDLSIADLRAQGVDIINTLFIDPREEAQATLKRLADTYGRQVWTNPVLREQYIRAYQIATGQPWPTEKAPETVGIPGQRTGEGGLSRFLAPQGVQQIPTGRTIQQPILPQAEPVPTKRVYITDAKGAIVNVFDVPQGSEVRQVQGEAGPKTVTILDASGNIVRTIELPPGGAVHQLPRPTPAGKAVSTEGLSPAQKRVVDNYNKLIDQRTRLLQIASTSFDEQAKKDARNQIATLDKRIAQLQPQVDKLLGVGGQGKTITMAEIRVIAQAEGKTVDAVAAAARAEGYTIVGAPAPGVGAAPAPGVGAAPKAPDISQAQAAVIYAAQRGLPFPSLITVARGFTPTQITFLRGVYQKYLKRK